MEKSKYSSEIAVSSTQYIDEENYWLNKLQGELEKITFPYDGRKIGINKGETGNVKFRLSDELFSMLLKASRGSDVRIHMILTAGLVGLLNKYTGNKDVIVGTSIYRQETEGIFVNTVLALRNLVDDNMTFKELLVQVRETISEANKNANYPVETLLYQLNIPFSGENFPLFDIAVLLENIHDKEYIRHIPLGMVFNFHRRGEYIEGILEYCPAYFNKASIERIIAHYTRFLQNALFNARAEIGTIDIFSEEERKQVLYDFNNTETQYPGEWTLHGLFENQVEKTPGHIALIYENARVTYGELNRKAGLLAGFLRSGSKGVNTDSIVGLKLDRSIEMIVGILGVLKAGGSYLPIDPRYPWERIKYIVENSGVEILISDRPEEPGTDVSTVIDINDPSLYAGPVTIPGTLIKSSDAAYVIYTSGTTGRPKGVVIEHSSAVNTLVYRKEEYKMKAGDVSLQLFSYSFDGFITSFFTPVISGASVVLMSEEAVKDITRIRETVITDRVTHFISIPVLYRGIIENLTEDEAAALKVVTLAGDKVSPNIIERTEQKSKNIEIVNEYGVTEAAVMSTLFRHQENHAEISIGKPAWNTKIYIRDEKGRIQPIGVWGELCIAGIGVARGYLNNLEFTGDQFFPNPCSEGERIYKTGDLARWLPDGNIEYMGRMDHQVKLRGYRIELGEIESQLLTHPDIKDAVVIVKEAPGGSADGEEELDKRLCVYFVSDREMAAVSDLREYLARQLPDYMIPSYFEQIEKIPLTPNGKIDLRALPEPTLKAGENYIAPRDDVEELLANIWAEVLGIQKEIIGINANFFELGGHSLKATIMTLKVYKELNVKLSLPEVFKTPRIRELAGYIRKAAEDEFASIEVLEKKEYYDVSCAQKQLWILHQFGEEQVAYNIPGAYVFEKLNREAFEKTLKTLIKRHEILRTTFIMVGGEPKQRIHDFESCGFRVDYIDLREDENREIVARKLSNEEARTTFNLEKMPLFRAKLLHMKDARYIFLFTMHHIVSDGWSMRVLVNEVLTLYNAYSKGENNPLALLRIQYRDFSAWQNIQLNGESINRHQTYWWNKFSGEIPILEIAADYPRPAVKTFNGKLIKIELDKATVKGLKELSKKNSVNFFITLIASIKALLYRYSGQEDIIIGLPVAGREHIELENQIGFYVNSLPVRTKFSGEETFERLLSRVKETVLGALEHQVYSFDRLVDDLDLKRDMSRSPLFDVVVQFLNFEGIGASENKEMEGVSLKNYYIDSNVSKFDLIFNFIESKRKLGGSIIYNTDIFEEESIVIMFEKLKLLLREIISNSDRCINDIEIEMELEREINKNSNALKFDFE